ncbi:MAG: hypothetical protein FWC16_06810 [Defluviitaleaceae bacterium]|nr:hypothetical protein [Defluviitaleaceae bacterium]MCL2274621.1 hypothetical protein [Defluviitaleaceae bacterium]
MDNRILDALKAIRDTYGDAVFYNVTTTRNLLADLAPDLRKERIQITHFLDMGGYFPLKYAEKEYDVVRSRLVEQLMATYSTMRPIADWVLDIFSKFLGYNLDEEKGAYKPPDKPTGKPLIGDRIDRKDKPAVIKNSGRIERSVEKKPITSALYPAPPLQPTQRTEEKPSKSIHEYNFPTLHLPESAAKKDPTLRIAADYHSVAITRDGFVKAVGLNSDGQCNTITYDWRDMAAVSAGGYYTVGLRADGTVTSAGRNDFGQRDFLGWREVVGISAGARHTVGLRADGTLLSTGQNKHGECDVRHWRNIVKVIAGNACTFGIKKDGRVLVSGRNIKGDLQASHLNGVVDIAYGGPGRVIALLSDGRIARVGQENHMRRSFTLYKDVKQIVAAPDYFAGLMEDGTVKLLAYFWTDCGTEAAVTDWTGIRAIAAGRYHILGWQNDRLIGAMLHPDIGKDKGQLSVTRWEM